MDERINILMKIFCAVFICLSLSSLTFGQTEKELFKRGLTKMEAQDFEGAELDFTLVLKFNPRNDAAYYNRGYTRMLLGDSPGAIQDFSLALDINPANPEAYYNRGRARNNLEDYLGAMLDFNIALKAKPKEIRFYRARAKAKSGLRDYRGAIKDLDMAIRLSKGKNMDLVFERAEAYINLKDFISAVQDLDRVVKTRPNDPSAYNARASIKLQGGDLNGACLDWSKAGELGDVNAYSMIRKHCNN